MRIRAAVLSLLAFLPIATRSPARVATAVPNVNRIPAGTLRDGVLTIALEASLVMWHPDGDSLPGLLIEGFSEPGKAPQVPGPLIRVPEGTEIRATVRNVLERDTLTFHLPKGGPASSEAGASDSIVVPPGATRELRTRVRVGSHLYRATTSDTMSARLRIGGALMGALVVDSAARRPGASDRIFVLQVAADSIDPANGFAVPTRSVFAINGRSWPHTERLTATVGDTARWRIINASWDVHPMHLHGFYYRVDAFDGPMVERHGQGALPRMVVTERMSELSTMAISWVPERAGNWLFHCHFQTHVVAHGPLSTTPSAARPRIGPQPRRSPGDTTGHANHAATGMAGLVMGIDVRPRAGERIAEPSPGRRRLRLLAIEDPAFPDSAPSMRFVLDDGRGDARSVAGGPKASPVLELTRGEPVSITVVNELREATTVHWHGMELESYFDGVAGFAGSGTRLAPMIAPRDSFEARFTPPRSGTFIYHSHIDEPRQHRAGLIGPLIVREPGDRPRDDDLVFMLKSARAGPRDPVVIEVNGTRDPDTLVLRARHTYRLRFAGMTTANPGATVWITGRADSAFQRPADTLVAMWRPVAKDGADLPVADRVLRPARQTISMGETYDFEFTPQRPGAMRIEIRAQILRERLFVRIPLKVE